MFLFFGGWYREWEEKASRPMEFELCSLLSRLKQPKFYVFMFCIICFISYKQSLQWWFRCMRLQACFGSVCVGGTTLMCRGRECARLGSATRRIFFYALWSVEVYVPQGPHQGAEVVFGYTYVSCERYTPNIYRCIRI